MKCFVLLGIFLASVILAEAQPRLVIEGGDTVNWGKVKMLETLLKRKVIFRNTGTDTLKIIRVKPGCGCTTAPISKDNIEPGGIADLDITLTVPGHSGEIHKLIFINSNDPANKDRVMHLMADVIYPLKFFPDKLITLFDMAIGKESIGKVIITNITDHPITIKKVTLEPKEMTTDLKDDVVIAAGKDLTVTTKVMPTTNGPFMGLLKFKTDDPDANRVELSVRGLVGGSNPK